MSLSTPSLFATSESGEHQHKPEHQAPTRKKSLTEHINALGLRITRLISKESETDADSAIATSTRRLRPSDNFSIYSVESYSNLEKNCEYEFLLFVVQHSVRALQLDT